MTTQKPIFDMEAAIKALREGKDLTGKEGVLPPLIKQLTESAIQAELNSHLAEDSDIPNRKNGNTPKTVKSTSAPLSCKYAQSHCANARLLHITQGQAYRH